jgi:hypothetical protein
VSLSVSHLQMAGLRLLARGGEGDLPGDDLGAPQFNCAPFCAPPRSKKIAMGGSREGKQIACTDAGIQHNSRQS